MNIALFTDSYPPFINGVSTSVYNLEKTLRAHGHNVIVVCPRTDDGKLEFKDGVIRMPGLQLKWLYGYRLTKFYDKKVIKILKENNIQIIHNQTDSTVGTFGRKAAKKLKVPLIYTYHTSMEDYSAYVSQGYLDRASRAILRMYSKIVAKSATEYITPSLKTKSYMRSIGNDIFINIIPTGIEFDLFDESRRDYAREEAFKKDHGITNNTKVMLILGRMGFEKSIDVLIKNFAKYKQKHPNDDIKVIAVGDGPQRHEYELLAHELRISQDIIFIGSVPASEVPFYYHLSDVYMCASLSETQGLTFLEAMAAKNLIVARFDNNLTDTIIEGVTGFYFSDEDTFVRKVEKIFSLSKEEKEAIYSNQRKLMEKFSMERFYNSVIDVYKRALKKYW